MTNQQSPESQTAIGYVDKVLEKMLSLCDRYGIPHPQKDESDDGWFMLAWHLTIEREPTLRLSSKKTGAPLKPDVAVRDMMILHALGSARPDTKSINAAALHLSKNPRFKGKSPDSIRTRFYVLKDAATPEGQRIRKLVRSLQADSSKDTCT